MKKIKVIALDVDGTITFRDKTLDFKGVEAIKKAKESGLIVILASGIPVQGLRPVAGLVGASEYLIGENGGVIFDGKDIEILSEPGKAKECFEELKQEYPEVEDYSKADTRLSEVCLKLGLDENKIKKIADKHGLKVIDTGFATHLMGLNVSKGAALEKLLTKLGFKPEECAAVGDSVNDIEMLKVCGLGIAVGNAKPGIKEVADYVTKAEHGSGVMEAVDYILNQSGN